MQCHAMHEKANKKTSTQVSRSSSKKIRKNTQQGESPKCINEITVQQEAKPSLDAESPNLTH